MTNSDDVRKFLTTRRARLTPEDAGLPAYGGTRRVAGNGGTSRIDVVRYGLQ